VLAKEPTPGAKRPNRSACDCLWRMVGIPLVSGVVDAQSGAKKHAANSRRRACGRRLVHVIRRLQAGTPYPLLFRRPYDEYRESMPPARRREFSTPGGRNGQKPLSTAHPVTTCIRAEGINGHMAVGHGKGHQECEQKARRNRPFSRRVSVAEIARRFSISAQYVSTGDVRFTTAFQRMATKPH
jgi:hypothetical protein